MKSKLALYAILALTISLFPNRSAFSQQKLRTDIDKGFQQDINKAVQDAVKLLKPMLLRSNQIGYNSVGAYALLAAGVKENDPSVQKVIKEILAKFDSQGNYKAGGGIPVYVAGVDLLALEKTKNGRYLPQIQAIADFLVGDIDPDAGFWSYPGGGREKGDTSQSQYALLGLWAAKRAGAQIPASIWRKAAQWHVDTQASNGSFFYHPGRAEAARQTMGVAGIGSLLICRNMLAGVVELSTAQKKKKSKKDPRFKVLTKVETGRTREEIEKEKELERQRKKAANASSGSSQTGAAIGKGMAWFNGNYRVVTTLYPMYYMYSIERLGALSGKRLFGGNDWYKIGAEYLIEKQQSNGEWPGMCGTIASTSYGILFLVRATGGPLGINYLGDGTIRARSIGVDFTRNFKVGGDGTLTYSRKFSAIEDLLEELSKTDISDEAILEATDLIVKQIKFDPKDRMKLLDPKMRKTLMQLFQHKKWDVRQVAVWALGKTGTIENAPKLIAALSDRNISVQREAHLALCFLSRNPLGPTDKDGKHLSEGPGSDLPENASKDVRTQAEVTWKKDALARWNAWYFRIRPYEQRDDLRDSAEKEKQKRMKGGKKK